MADNRPPLPSQSSNSSIPYGDPFADRPRQAGQGIMPSPYASQAHIGHPDGAHDYEDDEFLEKQPLTTGGNFAGGFYPPA